MGLGPSGGLSAGEVAAAADLRKSIGPHLQEGEELVAVSTARKPGGWASGKIYVTLEVNPPGGELPKKMAVAVTTRRLVVFATEGWVERAKSLVLEIPLAEIGSVELRSGVLRTSQLRWAAQGRQYTLGVSKPANAQALARGMQQPPPAP